MWVPEVYMFYNYLSLSTETEDIFLLWLQWDFIPLATAARRAP